MLRPLQRRLLIMFVRLDNGFLRRESQSGQQFADRAWCEFDSKLFLDNIGNDFRCPSFIGIASSNGTADDDLLELLFLFIIETWYSAGTLFPNEGAQIFVVLVECLAPIVDGTWCYFHYIGNGFVVISFENQLAALKPLLGLGR